MSAINEHVVLKAGCAVGPQVHLTGHTTAGDDNRFHADIPGPPEQSGVALRFSPRS